MFNINCSPKSPCIPCYVVCKYDRPARENAIFTHCSSKFTSYWSFQIQTFPSAKLSFCSWWCLCNELADYFKESKSRPCLLRTSSISDPGKIYPWLKCFFGGYRHHRGVLSLTFLTRGFLGSSSHLPFILAALLAARYSSSVTSSLKQALQIGKNIARPVKLWTQLCYYLVKNDKIPTLLHYQWTSPEWIVVKHVGFPRSNFQLIVLFIRLLQLHHRLRQDFICIPSWKQDNSTVFICQWSLDKNQQKNITGICPGFLSP